MNKILFCDTDILRNDFADCRNSLLEEFRTSTLDYFSHLVKSGNQIVFISRDFSLIKNAELWCKNTGYDDFSFGTRQSVSSFISRNNHQKNRYIVIGTKDVDFQLAVNNKLLLVLPTWLPCERKVLEYGLPVDNPVQLRQLISIMINNNMWYAQVQVDEITQCISLYDARTKIYGVSDFERNMLTNFQLLLKEGRSRSYYQILLYYFLANMTRDTIFDDIEIFGVMPSSSGMIACDLFEFVEKVRVIKKVRYPQGLKNLSPEEKNILIRHTYKPKQHIGNQNGRALIGGTHEFETMILNPAYQDKIANLRERGKLNICIFDDYMNYGNGFNAVRCMLEAIGANKIVLVSMGMFRQSFLRKDYVLEGDVFRPGYKYSKLSEMEIRSFKIYDEVKSEIELLHKIYNM